MGDNKILFNWSNCQEYLHSSSTRLMELLSFTIESVGIIFFSDFLTLEHKRCLQAWFKHTNVNFMWSKRFFITFYMVPSISAKGFWYLPPLQHEINEPWPLVSLITKWGHGNWKICLNATWGRSYSVTYLKHLWCRLPVVRHQVTFQ